MRDFLILYINGQRHEIRGERAFQSLTDLLRYDLGLVGTKVVCAEGDCGSCTLFLGRAARDGSNRIDYQTVCSCIQFLPQLDCTHIVTVEGLNPGVADASRCPQLHPVQEAMVRCHGAQCGFCTPGFVMSMAGMYETQRAERATTEDVREACIGNLCRCTGYEPIMKAGAEVDPASVKPLNQLYPPSAIVEDLRARDRESVCVTAPTSSKTFCKPASVNEAVLYRAEHPDCTIIAGGTDVGVQMNKALRDPRDILSLSALHELRTIEVKDGAIVAGALCSIAMLERTALDAIPEYGKVLYYFGSPPIKNAGTVGGNIANGSPIADSMPAMYVLNAEIELTGPNGSRRVNINQFFTGYKQTVGAKDEIITRVIIPIPKTNDGETLKLYKVSRRKDLDISAFTAAIWMKRSANTETIEDIRIAYGGVGPNILRLPKTEAFFRGNALTMESVREAGKIARSEITPIDDVRGGARYRSQLGENILRKLYSELAMANGNGYAPSAPRRQERQEKT